MTQTNTLYEIHVHGDIPLRKDISPEQIEEILKPLWRFAGAASLREGAVSLFEEEPGLIFDMKDYTLRICWTAQGDDSFNQVAEEFCQKLNEVAREGAPIEVSYFDSDDDNAEDEFQLYFVGPSVQAIVQTQRDLLVKDTIELMERHFDASELSGIVAEIDRLFAQRMSQLESSSVPVGSLWSSILLSASDGTLKRRLH